MNKFDIFIALDGHGLNGFEGFAGVTRLRCAPDENRYEIGHTQAAMFPDNYSFGGLSWRYTLPGHGVARWTRMFQMLQQGGYRGVVCIEHEDQNFYDGDAMQQRGFIAARDFLVHA